MDEFNDLKDDVMVRPSDVVVWVDPLDATQEYTEGLYKFVTTMVCVAVNGRATIGIVHYPFESHTVWGWVNHGASPEILLDNKPDKNIAEPLTVIASRSHPGAVARLVKAALGNNTKIESAGGAGYKTVQVLKGEANAYIHLTAIKKWDICASNALVSAAHGRMTTLHGKDIDYSDSVKYTNNDGLIVAKTDYVKIAALLAPLVDKYQEEAKSKQS